MAIGFATGRNKIIGATGNTADVLTTAPAGTEAGVIVRNIPSGTQKVSDSDSLGQPQYNFPAGFVRTTDEPRQVFYDPFDSALDVTNRWNAPAVFSSGVAATVTAGVLSLGTGLLAGSYSYLSSQPSFTPTAPAWLGYSFTVKLADGAAPTANTYRFWGAGTVPALPTPTAPLTDACGFEVDTAGKMWAVVYAAGVRTAVQDLSASGNNKQPLDANNHRYIVYYRTDKIYFYIDGIDTPVATANFTGPTVQTLPIRFLAVAGATPPLASGVINCTGLAVWDTGKNGVQLADGKFPWRRASIDAAGAVAIQNDFGNPIPVAGPLTDLQLRQVPVSTLLVPDTQANQAGFALNVTQTDPLGTSLVLSREAGDLDPGVTTRDAGLSAVRQGLSELVALNSEILLILKLAFKV